jgi:predicted secreted protein
MASTGGKNSANWTVGNSRARGRVTRDAQGVTRSGLSRASTAAPECERLAPMSWRLLRRFLTATAVGAVVTAGTLLVAALVGVLELDTTPKRAILAVAGLAVLVWATRAIREWLRTPVAGMAGARAGEPRRPGSFELVLADDRTRVPLVGDVTLGRDPSSTVVLADPTVSRRHALITPGGGDEPPLVEDAGSRLGTFVDGVRVTGPTRLYEGARLRLGNSELTVERRDESQVRRTILARPPDALPEPEQSRPRVRYHGWGVGLAAERPEPGQRQVPYPLQVAATVAGILTGVAGVVIGVLSL